MSQAYIPLRSEVPVKYRWNAESVYGNTQDWEEEVKEISNLLPEPAKYQGRLHEGPQVLLAALDMFETLFCRAGKVFFYAHMSHEVDTTDSAASAMLGKAQSLLGQTGAALAYIDPELIAIGAVTLRQWISDEPQLKIYEHYFDNLFRIQEHVRSAEVEEILNMLADPFAGTATTAGMLTAADFKFKPAHASDGSELPVTDSGLEKILAEPDREARRTAWESYMDTYLTYKNTLANNLSTSIKQNVFIMHARRHKTSLMASLFENNVPEEVFYNLIDTFKRNLPTWHRYWAIRRKALGVETLEPYDIWAPLSTKRPTLAYDRSVDLICQGLAPMGEGYTSVVRKGCLEDRWVDWMPNQGKSAGAFSAGWPGTFPFILMSFDGTFYSLGTLAHELGHSMHSYLSWQSQPYIYSQYSLFAAEVASNFHQALVRGYLLKSVPDRNFQIGLIEEAMSNFHRYFFIMPTLARFELEIHQRVESGDGLTADDMIELMADLFSEAYGGQVHVDRPRVGITWATFSHLYQDYYVFQYATGISAAHAFSDRILRRVPGAVDDYLGFLKSGNSLYPLDALKQAGVDLTSPQPVEETFKVLSDMVDSLEKLLG
jgi:oligoendopeptidase F